MVNRKETDKELTAVSRLIVFAYIIGLLLIILGWRVFTCGS